ncbi:MAG: hypothetical protein WA002_08805 [Candidatus Acidiferrales bacterium]
MLPAKLFAILTILPLGAALLEGKPTPQSVDMYVHTTYFVVTIGERRPQIEMALVTGCFALIYFAAARWVKHPLNNSLGLAHFAMATVGFVALLLSEHALRSMTSWSVRGGQAPIQWPFYAFPGGGLCFLISCAAFATNIVWTAAKSFRSR